MKNIWVTGAGGMMGSHLMEILSKSNKFNLIGSFYKPTIDLNEIDGYNLEEINVSDWNSVHSFITKFRPDMIYHLAAQSYPVVSLKRPIETINTNVIGTINIFESVISIGLNSKIIVACSSAEYGYVDDNSKPITEVDQLRPLHPYGVSKVAQDMLAYQYFQNNKIDTIRARFFNCTGPRKVNDVLSDFIRRVVRIEKGQPDPIMKVGSLETIRTIVDVRDLNNALILLSEKGVSGDVYNVGGNKAYLIRDLLKMVLERSKQKNIIVKEDSGLIRPTDEKIIWGDISKLNSETGWIQRISIETTIDDMFDYWRNKVI